MQIRVILFRQPPKSFLDISFGRVALNAEGSYGSLAIAVYIGPIAAKGDGTGPPDLTRESPVGKRPPKPALRSASRNRRVKPPAKPYRLARDPRSARERIHLQRGHSDLAIDALTLLLIFALTDRDSGQRAYPPNQEQISRVGVDRPQC